MQSGMWTLRPLSAVYLQSRPGYCLNWRQTTSAPTLPNVKAIESWRCLKGKSRRSDNACQGQDLRGRSSESKSHKKCEGRPQEVRGAQKDVHLLRKSTGNKPRREASVGGGAAAGKDIGVGVPTPIGCGFWAQLTCPVETALLTWEVELGWEH